MNLTKLLTLTAGLFASALATSAPEMRYPETLEWVTTAPAGKDTQGGKPCRIDAPGQLKKVAVSRELGVAAIYHTSAKTSDPASCETGTKVHVNAILWDHLSTKPVPKPAKEQETAQRPEGTKVQAERASQREAVVQVGIPAAKWEWVRVIEATNRFRSGEFCGISSPGRLVKTGQASGNQVHLRYSHDKANGAGPACDNGMLVAVDRDYMVRLGADLGDQPQPSESAAKRARREKL